MKRLAIPFSIALFFLLPTSVAAAECQFVLGFATLRSLVGPDTIGECLENEHYNHSGDSVQQTTGGLLVWRKADNWTAFTDGYRTWINGPNGLVQRLNTERFAWEADYTPGDGIATPTAKPMPTSTPTTALHATPEEAIAALPWVQDGVSSEETRAHNILQDLARLSQETLMTLVVKSWVQDEIGFLERVVLWEVQKIAEWHPPSAQRFATMSFLETVEVGDITMLQSLTELRGSRPDTLQRFFAQPEFAAGLSDDHMGHVLLFSLDLLYPAEAATIRSFSWIQDGTTDTELGVLQSFQRIAMMSHSVLLAAIRKSWVQDDLTKDELRVLLRLPTLSRDETPGGSVPTALRLLSMPFMDSIDGADAAAMEVLSLFISSPDRSKLHRVLSHPTLRDGIGDEHTALISVLNAVDNIAPELMETMLDPGQIFLERQTLSLSEFGGVTLAVISASQETTSNNMVLLERAVRNHVEFMGTPLPKSYVALWVNDKSGGGGGASGILYVGSHDSPATVAHEAAHVYWPFPPSWIAEGAATFLEIIAENVRVGTPVEAPNDGKCALAGTLLEHDMRVLERSQRGMRGYLGLCPYNLGSGLFVDLYHSLGDDAFRQSFRRLFVKLSYSHHIDECKGVERGVCYVKAAFVTDDSPDSAMIAEPIINRWYYGSEHGPQ